MPTKTILRGKLEFDGHNYTISKFNKLYCIVTRPSFCGNLSNYIGMFITCITPVGGTCESNFKSPGLTNKYDFVIGINEVELPSMIYKNHNRINEISKYQDEYSIWNIDGTLNEYRLSQLLEDGEYQAQ